jgi:hypothetical protein
MRTPMLFLCASLVMTEAAEFRSQASGPALKKVAEFDLPSRIRLSNAPALLVARRALIAQKQSHEIEVQTVR